LLAKIKMMKRNDGVSEPLSFYEFFAGGGMARIGLGPRWRCAFANEWSAKKAESYRSFFKGNELTVEDVGKLTIDDLPGTPELVWASFPCQDLSLAGSGAGLNGQRSGTFRKFWKLMDDLAHKGRTPPLVVLENVAGALTSHEGRDFIAIMGCLAKSGYRAGALVIDAAHFLPQSRPRLFIIGIDRTAALPPGTWASEPSEPWHTKSLRQAHSRLPESLRKAWLWWTLPVPNCEIAKLSRIIEDEPAGVAWHSPEQTRRLIGLMSPLHIGKLEEARQLRTRVVGAIYKRTRKNSSGLSEQRAEVRFDHVAGCLRTPVGGSSRQSIVIVNGDQVRTRLLSPREAARLMGVPDCYPLPENYNDAYHLVGDGLAVPAVSWLEQHLLGPLALHSRR
jgi:DNA (cytosine-5)-methyltransferase 1